MKINHLTRNPILRYKLDPGEPGLATATPASRSIAKVATHEATNIRRFKREAMEEGATVVYSFIGLKLSYQGGYLAATAGKSKALIIYPDPSQKVPQLDRSDQSKTEDEKIIADDEKLKKEELPEKTDKSESEPDKNIIGNINKTSQEDTISVIKDHISNLEQEKVTLKSQLKDQVGQKPGKEEEEEKDNTYRENELSRIEKRLAYLKQKLDMERQKKFLENLMDSQKLILNLLNLKYNKDNLKINGQLIDDLA